MTTLVYEMEMDDFGKSLLELGGNNAIIVAHECGHCEIVRLLLLDPRVTSLLSNEEIEKYKKQINDKN